MRGSQPTVIARTLAKFGAAGLAVVALLSYTSQPAAATTTTTTISFGTLDSVARAANGDTVEISGEGTVTLHPKSASGDGGAVADAFGEVPRTFTHRDANGNVLAEGTWEPTAVLDYRSYGPATEEQSEELGGLPPGSEGGKLRIKVALLVDGKQVHKGIITIVCLLGAPPQNAMESTLLLIKDTTLNFHQPVSGNTIFIRE